MCLLEQDSIMVDAVYFLRGSQSWNSKICGTLFGHKIFFMAGFEVPMGHNDLALRWNSMGPLRGLHSRFCDFCRFGWNLTRLTFLAARVWNLAQKPRHWYRWLQSSVLTTRSWNFEKKLIFAGFWPPLTPGPTSGRGLHAFQQSWWFITFISNFSKFVVQTRQNKHLLP